ncbi:Restriction modification system DNA specificity domain protein [Alloalcanivorax dieselolei B5]|uniref:Restriction modification system DNA specificity domain protein n=1 Tax=Alcanivorax dieselolei (strain DSM 16502 / CGMCC 1.3690 / MCCC 1A00001 / B-5) TaxID=930169 RepID=K0CI39_ALCDB|nr:restriction endonuclease subunit S [Alloalcanivorax dieselolei]AFT71382.1 Restriction modification system DNA specificity domain protein [Alloalcanivorax dieselolei B5]GGK08357.1 hypothetical protein GCM10007426_40840 [Alloalcanivorax dieselolei]
MNAPVVTTMPLSSMAERKEKADPQGYPDMPYVGLDDVEPHTMRLIGWKSAAELKSSAKKFYKWDVLYSRLRPYLNKVWVADRDGLCSSEFIVLPKQEDIDPKFLAYRINARDFVTFANSLNSGDRPRVNFKQISSFGIPAFDVDEQRLVVDKIETLFSELDKGIESLKTARQQLKAYRQAVLKHAFEGKLTEQWRQQNPDKLESPEQLLTRIQQEREQRYQQQLEDWKQAVKAWEENGKEGKKPSKPKRLPPATLEENASSNLPDCWGWTKLGAIISYGPSNGWSPKAVNYETPIKAITLTATTSGKFDGAHFKYLDTHVPKKSELWIKKGDILVQRGNTIEYVGVPALYKGADNRFVYPDLIMKIQSVPSINRQYLVYAMSEHRARSWLRDNAVGAAGSMPKISQSTLTNLIVPICSKNEQKEIEALLDSRISAADALDAEISFQIEKAEILRQSILEKAFSGQLISQVRDKAGAGRVPSVEMVE